MPILLRRQAALVGGRKRLRGLRAVLPRGPLRLRRGLGVLQGCRIDLLGAGGVLLRHLAALAGAGQKLVRASKRLHRAQRVLLRGAVGLHCARGVLRGALQRLLGAGGVLGSSAPCLLGAGSELLGAGQLLRGRTQQGGAVAVRVVVEVRSVTRGLNRRERAVPQGARRQAGGVSERAVLLADERAAVDLNRATARSFGAGIPVAVGRHDREVLLARVLNRVLRHAGVDAVGHARIVAAHPRQALARRRRAVGRLRKQLAEPGRALGRVEVVDREVLARVDRPARRRVFRLDRNEADAEAVGQRCERQARGALGQAHARAVVRVPDREVGALIGRTRAGVRAHDHTGPSAATVSALRVVAGWGFRVGAGRADIGERLRAGVVVIKRRARRRRTRDRRRAQRLCFVGNE